MTLRKSDQLANWRAMRNTARVDPLPLMRALPYKATGTTYGADGVRIDGSPAFIDAVLSCLTELLPGESDSTRLDFARRDVKPIGGKTWENSSNGAQVCYIRLRERGPQAAALRALGIIGQSDEKAAPMEPVLALPPVLPLELELCAADYDFMDDLDDVFDDEEIAEFVPPVASKTSAEILEDRRPWVLTGAGDVRALGFDKPADELTPAEKLEVWDRAEAMQRPATYAAEKLASEKRAAKVASGKATPAAIAAFEREQAARRMDEKNAAGDFSDCEILNAPAPPASYATPAARIAPWCAPLPPRERLPLAEGRRSIFAKKSRRAIDKRAKIRANRAA